MTPAATKERTTKLKNKDGKLGIYPPGCSVTVTSDSATATENTAFSLIRVTEMSFMNFVLIVNCVKSESGAPRFTPSLITPVGVMKVALKDDLNQYFANHADNPAIKFAFCSRNMKYSTGSKFHILIDVGEIEKKN